MGASLRSDANGSSASFKRDRCSASFADASVPTSIPKASFLALQEGAYGPVFSVVFGTKGFLGTAIPQAVAVRVDMIP